jgi:2-polyprenyl-3-methyl-5-hydroxy-6-metoxy-1,4-benzoquinol methylase
MKASTAVPSSTKWTKEDVLEFLARERLKYQKIELPYGLSTPGNERHQLFEIAFGGDLAGKSVLDVGSYLGAFCLEALRRGASEAVGIELNPDRLRQARAIAEMLGRPAEYRQVDIDELSAERRFDVCLCLNILHHLRDPIRLLHTLADVTRERLILEIASLGLHDRKRIRLGAWKGRFLRGSEIVLVAPGTPEVGNQKFFFTKESLARILDGHMKKFFRVEMIDGELKNRFIVRAEKLAIDDLVVVSGPSGSGKTTLSSHLAQGRYDAPLGRSLANAAVVPAKKVAGQKLSSVFERNPVDKVVYHYETTRLEKFRIHEFSRDTACDIFGCAKRVDFIIVAPRKSTLKQQMLATKVQPKKGKKQRIRKNILEQYQRDGWIENHYREWFRFCSGLPIEQKRIFAFSESAGGRDLCRLESEEQLLSLIDG